MFNFNAYFYGNDVYCLMRLLGLKSVCRRKHRKYIRTTPEVISENILNRKFYADKPNKKWLTDVTKFKYNDGVEIKKAVFKRDP